MHFFLLNAIRKKLIYLLIEQWYGFNLKQFKLLIKFITFKYFSLISAPLLCFFPPNLSNWKANQARGNFSRQHIPYSPYNCIFFYPSILSSFPIKSFLSFITKNAGKGFFSSSFSKFLKDLYNSNNGFQLRQQNFNSIACVGLYIFLEKRSMNYFFHIPCVQPQRDVIN